MPDKNGWHDRAFVASDGVPRIWHYCRGANYDTLVVDTLEHRRAHERECMARQRKLAQEQAKVLKERRLEALKSARLARA